jgi:hypothetical protein
MLSRKGERGAAAVVDTVFTLVIALGGIATGIGAIWAAWAARRQAQISERSLSEQRQFLKEQNEIARSQAQLTERSLAQTERSLAEQNERARLSLEYDLLNRLAVRFDTPQFRRTRRTAAKYLLDNAFADDDVVAADWNNYAMLDVCNFLEDVGEMLRLGVLRAEPVWNRYSEWAKGFWFVCKPSIEKLREELGDDQTIWEDFEYLCRVMAEMDRKRGVAPPTPEGLREFVEWEAVMGEEPRTTTTE